MKINRLHTHNHTRILSLSHTHHTHTHTHTTTHTHTHTHSFSLSHTHTHTHTHNHTRILSLTHTHTHHTHTPALSLSHTHTHTHTQTHTPHSLSHTHTPHTHNHTLILSLTHTHTHTGTHTHTHTPLYVSSRWRCLSRCPRADWLLVVFQHDLFDAWQVGAAEHKVAPAGTDVVPHRAHLAADAEALGTDHHAVFTGVQQTPVIAVRRWLKAIKHSHQYQLKLIKDWESQSITLLDVSKLHQVTDMLLSHDAMQCFTCANVVIDSLHRDNGVSDSFALKVSDHTFDPTMHLDKHHVTVTDYNGLMNCLGFYFVRFSEVHL